MMLIDSHSHLYSAEFNHDLDEAIDRCKENNIVKVLLPNIDTSSHSEMMRLCTDFPKFFTPMLGLHPCSVNKSFEKELSEIFSHYKPNIYCAIGEIGIDLYWDKTFLKEQIYALEFQIEFSKKHKLPIVLHVRDAFDEVFEVVDRLHDGNLSGVFHCFTGNIEQAEHIMAYKTFMMGIGGVVTFKKSGLDEVAKQIPLEYLILETDSPYLAPSPHRGKRNESSYLKLIAEKLSEIKNCSLEEIAEQTTSNCLKIFPTLSL
jgi:TatD DNase family protein